MTPSPRLSLLASALALAASGQAGAASITREFTAAWHDPTRPGHGLGLEVIDSNGSKNALAYWFTYDKSGRQLWLFGTAATAAGLWLWHRQGQHFGFDASGGNVNPRVTCVTLGIALLLLGLGLLIGGR